MAKATSTLAPPPPPSPTRRIRASSIKLAVLCAAAVQDEPGEILIDTMDPTATQSNEIHRAIALDLKGEPYPPFMGEDAGECEELVGRAIDWFDSGSLDEEAVAQGIERGTFLNLTPQTEVALEIGNVSGTIDLLLINKAKRIAAAVDWKNTFRDDDHTPQLIAYAWLIFMANPDVDEVIIFTAFLRLKVTESKRLTRAWVLKWMDEFIRNTLTGPAVYRPGEQCLKCRRFATCDALILLNRKTANELEQNAIATNRDIYLSRERIADLHPRVKLLSAVIASFKGFVNQEVHAGGPIPLANGKQLQTLTIQKKTILPLQAWSILEEEFTEGELAKLLKVPVGGITEAIEAKAPKGKKAPTSKAFLAKLAAAGAIEVYPEEQIREMNPKDVEHV